MINRLPAWAAQWIGCFYIAGGARNDMHPLAYIQISLLSVAHITAISASIARNASLCSTSKKKTVDSIAIADSCVDVWL